MRKTPNTVLIVCITVTLCTVIACFTALAYGGKNAADLRGFVNTILNIGGFVFGGGAFLVGGYAAARSGEAADNTNGKLKEHVSEAVTTAVKETLDNGG